MPPVSDPMSRVRDRNSSFKKASYYQRVGGVVEVRGVRRVTCV